MIDFGHKYGKVFGKRATPPTQLFWEYFAVYCVHSIHTLDPYTEKWSPVILNIF